jgi:hypothetical protein
MTQDQPREMLPADTGGEPPDFLATIDPKTVCVAPPPNLNLLILW